MSASGDDQLAALREQRRMELQRQLESQAQAQAEEKWNLIVRTLNHRQFLTP